MRLKVNLGKNNETYFYVDLYSNSFVNKYVDELEWHLKNCDFNQEESFMNFQSYEKNAEILKENIETINKFYKKLKIDVPEIIDIKDEYFFNNVHVLFEKISGEWGKSTKLFQIAPQHVKDAIRRLNLYLHLLEHEKNGDFLFYMSFNKDQYRRKPLCSEDYQYFQHNATPGGFYLIYAELGKTFYDLYKDNLPYDYDGMKNLHFYSGEAYIELGNEFSFPKEFYDWCTKHGIDYTDKSLGIGFIEMGRVNNIEEVRNLLKLHQYLYSIKIERE